MNINELLPPELIKTACNLFRGTLVDKNHAFLLEKCRIKYMDLYISSSEEDRCLELEIQDPASQKPTLVDCRNPTELASNYPYYLHALCALLSYLGDQLPEWVFDESKFIVDTASCGSVTLTDYRETFEEVWQMVFNNKRPLWRTGEEPLSSLETHFLHRMFGAGGESDKLPQWLGCRGDEANYKDYIGLVPVSLEFLDYLQYLYEDFQENETQKDSSKEEFYISPFTGEKVDHRRSFEG